MKYFTLIPLLITLISCAPAPIVEIDPSLQSYVDSFLKGAKAYGRTVKIKDLILEFQEEEQGVGVCYRGTVPTIHIDPHSWEGLNSTHRKILIYHELGHCLLHKQHNVEGVMRSWLMSSIVFEEDEEYYLELLFAKGN